MDLFFARGFVFSQLIPGGFTETYFLWAEKGASFVLFSGAEKQRDINPNQAFSLYEIYVHFLWRKEKNEKKHPPPLNLPLYEPTEKVAPFRTGLHKLTYYKVAKLTKMATMFKMFKVFTSQTDIG